MAKVDWAEALGAIIEGHGAKWPPDKDSVREAALTLAERFLGEERKEVAGLLSSALSGGKLERSEAIVLVTALTSTWSGRTPFGGAFTQALLEALKDGELTMNEVAAAAAGWVASRSDNKNVQFFIREIADGKFSRDDMQSLLLDLVKKRRGAQASEALKALMAGKVLLSEVLLLVAGIRLSADAQANPGSTTDQLLQTLQAYLQDDTSAALDDALDKLVAGDASGLATAAITAVLKGDDFAVLMQKAVVDRLRERMMAILKKQLKKHVVGLEASQVDALSTTIVELLNGERSLFSPKTELEEFVGEHFPEEMFDLWTRVRKVLYAAKWATDSGSLVSTQALARPHVFAAAAVKPSTKLSSLAASGKERVFVECVQKFCAAEFLRDSANGRLQNPVNYPVSTDAIAAGAPASKVLLYVWIALKAGNV